MRDQFYEDYMTYNRVNAHIPFSKKRKERNMLDEKILEKYKKIVVEYLHNKGIIDRICTLKIKGGILQEETNGEYKYVFDIKFNKDNFGFDIYDVGYNGPGAYTSILGYRNSKKFKDTSFLNSRLIFDSAYTILYKKTQLDQYLKLITKETGQ